MNSTTKGLLGIAGIWLTMGMVPLAELLALTATQATFLRGFSGAVVIGLMAVFYRGLVTWPDQGTIRITACFVMATVCIFQAVEAWGANYMALFLDLAVLVPLFLAWRRKQAIGLGVLSALTIAVAGTVLTLRLYQGGVFVWGGFMWSLGALIANGLFIEYAGKAKQANWNKAFWMSTGLVLVGLPALTSGFQGADGYSQFTWLLLLGGFALTTGVLNFYSAFTAFAHLSAVSVGILVLGVTPTIMISSYIMLGKSMGLDQVIGVGMTLVAVFFFGNALKNKE